MFKKSSKKSQAKTPTSSATSSVLINSQKQVKTPPSNSHGDGRGQDLAAKEDNILEKYGGWEKFVLAHNLFNDNLEDLEKADVILKNMARG